MNKHTSLLRSPQITNPRFVIVQVPGPVCYSGLWSLSDNIFKEIICDTFFIYLKVYLVLFYFLWLKNGMVSAVPTKTTQNLMFESIISLYLKSILYPRVTVCLISYLAGSLLEERSTRKGWLPINHKELLGKCLLKASHQIIIKLIRGWYSQDCLDFGFTRV